MINARRTSLKKESLAHILRAAAGITGASCFVVVGTGAAIAQLKQMPLAMMLTREADIYVPDARDPASIADLIDGSIGEGSQFDLTYGYYAHGVDASTAMLPQDWRGRAPAINLPGAPGITCICPEINDLALSKVCAWRDKDRAWLIAGLQGNILDLQAMVERANAIDEQRPPLPDVIASRLDILKCTIGVGPKAGQPLGVGPRKDASPPRRRTRAKDKGIQ